MTDSETVRPTDIQALLAERKKFEAWLAQLDTRRESAASHVFERVHADYTKRLEDVRGRLRDEAETLRALVGDLETRLGKEQDRVTKKTDERAEAELRAMVGEYSEKEWNATRSKLDASIADLRAKFDQTERELAELKDLLNSVSGAQAPARPSAMLAAAATVAEALDEAATGSAPAGAPAPEGGTGVPAEPAAPEPPLPEPAAARPKPASPEPTPRKSTPFDELAFLRSVASTPSRPSGNAAVAKAPDEAVAPAPVTPELVVPELVVPDPVAEPAAEAAPEPPPPPPAEESSPLGAPTPRTSQAVRSLKCQECGTLNFPTEWYCERCGGELAAF